MEPSILYLTYKLTSIIKASPFTLKKLPLTTPIRLHFDGNNVKKTKGKCNESIVKYLLAYTSKTIFITSHYTLLQVLPSKRDFVQVSFHNMLINSNKSTLKSREILFRLIVNTYKSKITLIIYKIQSKFGPSRYSQGKTVFYSNQYKDLLK